MYEKKKNIWLHCNAEFLRSQQATIKASTVIIGFSPDLSMAYTTTGDPRKFVQKVELCFFTLRRSQASQAIKKRIGVLSFFCDMLFSQTGPL